jgi:histidinol-phosphate aminotransferase
LIKVKGDLLNKVTELNRNEISYPPPERIIKAASKALTDSNRYSKISELDELRSLLSSYSKAEEESIFMGSGAEVLIAQILHLFSRKGKVVIVDPMFFMITRIAEDLEKIGTKVLKIKLSEPSFSLPVEPLIEESKDASLVVIDNPNNPSGRILIDRDAAKELCESISGLLLVDEGYYEFSQFTIADMVKDYSNLVVVRTMSKAFGLAGLKLGYIIAGKDALDALSSLDLPLRPTRPSIYAAIEALKDTTYMEKNVELIVEERERVRKEASNMGVQVYPSCTNFLLMHTNTPYAAKKLGELGIIVFDPSNQLSHEFIRVSIGSKEENDAFLSALRKITIQHKL